MDDKNLFARRRLDLSCNGIRLSGVRYVVEYDRQKSHHTHSTRKRDRESHLGVTTVARVSSTSTAPLDHCGTTPLPKGGTSKKNSVFHGELATVQCISTSPVADFTFTQRKGETAWREYRCGSIARQKDSKHLLLPDACRFLARKLGILRHGWMEDKHYHQ